MGFSRDGKMVAAGCRRPAATIVCETATGRELFRWPWLKGVPRAVSFSPDGGMLASPMSDGSILFWDLTHAIARLEP